MEIAQDSQQLDMDIRHFIYVNFARTARPPTTQETSAHFGVSISRVEGSYHRLADSHQIALAPGSFNIWMAHPFSGVRTNFSMEIGGKKYWGN